MTASSGSLRAVGIPVDAADVTCTEIETALRSAVADIDLDLAPAVLDALAERLLQIARPALLRLTQTAYRRGYERANT